MIVLSKYDFEVMRGRDWLRAKVISNNYGNHGRSGSLCWRAGHTSRREYALLRDPGSRHAGVPRRPVITGRELAAGLRDPSGKPNKIIAYEPEHAKAL